MHVAASLMDVVNSPRKMFARPKDVVELRNHLPSRCNVRYFILDFVLTLCPAGPPLRDRAFCCATLTFSAGVAAGHCKSFSRTFLNFARLTVLSFPA
jgi:hypothetical protein